MKSIQNLDKSRYVSEVRDLKFYFSSSARRDRFDRKLGDRVQECTAFMKKKNNGWTIDLSKVCAVGLYYEVEPNGFRVEGDINDIHFIR